MVTNPQQREGRSPCMDHDHISLELAPIATIDDLRSDQHDICPSLLRAFYVARYLPKEGNPDETTGDLADRLVHDPCSRCCLSERRAHPRASKLCSISKTPFKRGKTSRPFAIYQRSMSIPVVHVCQVLLARTLR